MYHGLHIVHKNNTALSSVENYVQFEQTWSKSTTQHGNPPVIFDKDDEMLFGRWDGWLMKLVKILWHWAHLRGFVNLRDKRS